MISVLNRGVIAIFISLIAFSGFHQTNTASYSANIDTARAKFSAMSDEICLNSVKKITEEMGMSKEAIEAIGEQGMSLKAKELSSDLMQGYKNAFIITEAEAQKIVAGQFDEIKNSATIAESVKKMAALTVSLPQPIEYLINKSKKGTLSGIESEFAARLFTEYLRQQGK